MYKTIIVILTAIFLAVVFSVITDKHASVAVIDLDKVANEMGRSDSISAEIQDFVTAEEVKLNLYRDELAGKINNLKEEIGQNPSREQSQNFLLATRSANNEIQKRIALAQKEGELLKVKLVRDFRNEIKPIVRQIAVKNHFSLVEIVSPSQMYVDSGVDISDKVVDLLLQLKTNRGLDNIAIEKKRVVNE